ncbi:Structural maintenance of chromosomes protein 6, partial [Kappamyces sp. JEL0680]
IENQKKLDESKLQVSTIESHLKILLEECLSQAERVATNRSEDEIDEELKKTQALLKQKEKDRDEVYRSLKAKTLALRNAEMELKEFTELAEHIAKARYSRARKFEKFQNMISIRSRSLFSDFLQKRGYRGLLELDHDRKSLHLKVGAGHWLMQVDVSGNPSDEHDDAIEDKDPKSLSGGEKSYSTICLLLSLWESMATPFRALDEFDVFMDAVNRSLAVQLIVQYARDSTNSNTSQFILISPQNTSHLKALDGPDITTLKMVAPERNQTTLNFQSSA